MSLRAALLALAAAWTPLPVLGQGQGADVFPGEIQRRCFGGRAEIYDECGPQQRIYEAARAEALRSGRTLLVVYGAEWCIWCHVFARQAEGGGGAMSVTLEEDGAFLLELPRPGWQDDAARLAQLADARFVLAYIEGEHAPGGWDVLEETGAAAHFQNWIPFVFSVDPQGRFAAALPGVEAAGLLISSDLPPWRGYDRGLLIEALEALDAAAREGG